MTEKKAFKRRVRERMTKTGESYTSARKQVAEKKVRERAARARLAATQDRIADDKLIEATGASFDEWFTLLDRAGAPAMTHTQIARMLVAEHEVPGWWAQTITVWYERARGKRLKHQKADGFAVSASKTIAVPVTALFDSFIKPAKRKAWLKDGSLSLRTSQPNKTARFDWNKGTTRVVVSFEAKGAAKSTVVVAHEKLPDADDAETAKTDWRRRLVELKTHLES